MAGYDVSADTRATLAAWLRTVLPGLLPAFPVVVREEFPGPSEELPERCVSVVCVDAPPEVRFWPPLEWDPPVPVAPGSPTGTVRYSWGRFTVGLQLDVWARYPAALRELVAVLDDALHRHPQVTLPGGDGWPRPSRWHELTLAAGTLPGAVVYYRFPPGQPPTETGEAAQAAEHRVTWAGTAQGLLTTEESCAILRTFTLTETVGESAARPPDTFTLTGT